MKWKRRRSLLLCLALVMSCLLIPAALAEGEYDPPFDTASLDTGMDMRYAVLGEEGNPAVVLIHGATDSYYSYAQLAPLLAEAGYRVYVPELRGHGGSDKPEDGPYTLEQHVTDLNAFIAQEDIQNPYIVGHSLGSFVAQSLTAEYGEELGIQGLALIGTAASTVDNPTLTWMLQGDDAFPGISVFMEGVPQAFIDEWVATNNNDPAFAEHIKENAEALPGYSWVYTFMGLEDADNTEALQAIEVPVLIIWGTEDTFFTEADQERVAEALVNSPSVAIEKREGASHNTHWDEGQAEPIAEAIVRFMQQ